MSLTSTAFLADVMAVVDRGSAGGEGFADRPVYALSVGSGRGALREVERVGLTPAGQIVVLFSDTFRSPLGTGVGLILPPRLGGSAAEWTTRS